MPIRPGNSREGLDGIVPADHAVVGFNDLGDPLAVAPDGRVIEFQHDMGTHSVAFRSRDQFDAFVRFQDELAAPDDEDAAALRARKARIAVFARGMRGAPFAQEALAAVREELRDAIAERRADTSPRGRALAARHSLGAACEAAMRAAGCDRDILVRPAVDDPQAVVVWGDLAAPWTEDRLRALLVPLAALAKLGLRFVAR